MVSLFSKASEMDIRRFVPGKANKVLRMMHTGVRTCIEYVVSQYFEFVCPVCDKKVKEFLPLSTFYVENKRKYGNPYTVSDLETLNDRHYSCPHCSASDRDRLYALYFRQRFPQPDSVPSIRLLDIAPSRSLRIFLSRYKLFTYRSADLTMEGVDDKVDITDMSIYRNASFDVFICSHVLEHIPDDKKALSELFRVLRPEGWGILMVPINLVITQIDEDPSITDVGERWRRFGQHDHIRLYSKQGFLARVENAGFIVHQFGVGYFGTQAFQKHGISEKSVLYVVEKP